jgi:hypothetical protein
MRARGLGKNEKYINRNALAIGRAGQLSEVRRRKERFGREGTKLIRPGLRVLRFIFS